MLQLHGGSVPLDTIWRISMNRRSWIIKLIAMMVGAGLVANALACV